MPVVSSVFLVLALVLAVTLGPQTRPWTWGPALLALGFAALAAVPSMWRGRKLPGDFGLMALGAMVVGWFGWRAAVSPVREFAEADGILLAVAVAGFFVTRGLSFSPRAAQSLLWGLALVLVANAAVAGWQMVDHDFSAILPRRGGGKMATGFFTHYNEAANFFVACSAIVGASALLGSHGIVARAVLLTASAAGFFALFLTKSRGGWMAAIAAAAVLLVALLVHGKRAKSKWFPAAAIATPVILIAFGGALFRGWESLQELREQSGGVEGMMDNTIRLYMLGMAAEIVKLHPWSGGGSRSFSWESFRVWDKDAYGAAGARPEFAHNELAQAATDYGLTGFILVFCLLCILAIATIARTAFETPDDPSGQRTAWQIGGLAACAGMFIQSNFSFVFHLLPGVLLLGICMGLMSTARATDRSVRTIAVSSAGSVALLMASAFLLFFGWKGAQVGRALWSSYFGAPTLVSSEARIDALGEALRIWPTSALYRDRAEALHRAAGNPGDPGFAEFALRASDDYGRAMRLHPFDPVFPINHANLLAQLQRDEDAERSYLRAISLQGGMEAGFRSRYFLASHYLNKCMRLTAGGGHGDALEAIEQAAVEIEKAVDQTPPWVINHDGFKLRVAIHENLGAVREAAEDPAGALQAYDYAASLRYGRHVHYRAGVLLGRQGVDAWSQRRAAEALALFQKAKQRVHQAGGELPAGITAGQRQEFLDYLDRTIRFLQGARIQPAE